MICRRLYPRVYFFFNILGLIFFVSRLRVAYLLPFSFFIPRLIPYREGLLAF